MGSGGVRSCSGGSRYGGKKEGGGGEDVSGELTAEEVAEGGGGISSERSASTAAKRRSGFRKKKKKKKAGEEDEEEEFKRKDHEMADNFLRGVGRRRQQQQGPPLERLVSDGLLRVDDLTTGGGGVAEPPPSQQLRRRSLFDRALNKISENAVEETAPDVDLEVNRGGDNVVDTAAAVELPSVPREGGAFPKKSLRMTATTTTAVHGVAPPRPFSDYVVPNLRGPEADFVRRALQRSRLARRRWGGEGSLAKKRSSLPVDMNWDKERTVPSDGDSGDIDISDTMRFRDMECMAVEHLRVSSVRGGLQGSFSPEPAEFRPLIFLC